MLLFSFPNSFHTIIELCESSLSLHKQCKSFNFLGHWRKSAKVGRDQLLNYFMLLYENQAILLLRRSTAQLHDDAAAPRKTTTLSGAKGTLALRRTSLALLITWGVPSSFQIHKRLAASSHAGRANGEQEPFFSSSPSTLFS